MAFRQFMLDKSNNQSRGIFDQYVYSTTDTVAETQVVGYFEESRFSDDPDWVGSFITCKCSDGNWRGEILEGGSVVIADGLNGLTPEQLETFEHFIYNPVTDRLEADREIQTTLSTFELGNQWAISSSAEIISFQDRSSNAWLEPVVGGLADQSIPANQTTEAGVIQPTASYYTNAEINDFLGPVGTNNLPSGSGGFPWPANQIIVKVFTALGQDLNDNDWLSYTISTGVAAGGHELFKIRRPVTDFGSGLVEGDILEWDLDPLLRADFGEFYYGQFNVLEGGRDGPATPLLVKEALNFPGIAWGELLVRNFETVQIVPDPEERAVFVSTAGKDTNVGNRVIAPYATLAASVAAAEAITVASGEPGIVDGVGGGTFTEDLTLTQDLRIDLKNHELIGNITVPVGVTAYIDIWQHTGTISPSDPNDGRINGFINGVPYGIYRNPTRTFNFGRRSNLPAFSYLNSENVGGSSTRGPLTVEDSIPESLTWSEDLQRIGTFEIYSGGSKFAEAAKTSDLTGTATVVLDTPGTFIPKGSTVSIRWVPDTGFENLRNANVGLNTRKNVP